MVKRVVAYLLVFLGLLTAAGLAILTELLFGGIERSLVPPHMRSGSKTH